jgi:hypothetical protein
VTCYKQALALGSVDPEALKGVWASFDPDPVAAAMRIPNDRNRSFTLERPGDVDRLCLLLLGEASSAPMWGQTILGRSFLAAADAIVQSAQFERNVIKRCLVAGLLPHERLEVDDWWRVLEFLPEAGLSPASSSGIREDIDGDRLCEGDGFLETAYWELLWRRPDPDGREFHLARLRQGASKRSIVDGVMSSPEFDSLGRKVVVVWGDGRNTSDVAGAPDALALVTAFQALSGEAPPSGAAERQAQALEAGEVSWRGVVEGLLPVSGSTRERVLGSVPREPDWRGLLRAMFSRGPLARILSQRHPQDAAAFRDQLSRAPDEVYIFKTGPRVLSPEAFRHGPQLKRKDKIYSRTLDVYEILVREINEYWG